MLDFAGGTVVTILSFLVVITVVVTIHELGHYWAARACGIKIDAFSIGFGKRIFGWTDKRGVDWRVCWLPLGGYVKFSGDSNAASLPNGEELEELRQDIIAHEGEGAEKAYFQFKPVWQRAFVTIAGPAANFILTISIFSALLLGFGSTVGTPRVAEVSPGSAAAEAGIRVGDVITAADGKPLQDFEELRRYVILRTGDPIVFDVERGAEKLQITATPKRAVQKDATGADAEVGLLGVLPSNLRSDYRTVRYNPVEAVGEGTKMTFEVLGLSLRYISRVVTGRESADQLGGPVGIARTAGAVTREAAAVEGGMWLKAANVGLQLLQLVAFISVGIGFLNLLPIPVLDGGHLLFYGYEAVARRPLDARIQAAGFQVGLALLLGLMLFVTWNDLKKSPLFDTIGGLFS